MPLCRPDACSEALTSPPMHCMQCCDVPLGMHLCMPRQSCCNRQLPQPAIAGSCRVVLKQNGKDCTACTIKLILMQCCKCAALSLFLYCAPCMIPYDDACCQCLALTAAVTAAAAGGALQQGEHWHVHTRGRACQAHSRPMVASCQWPAARTN